MKQQLHELIKKNQHLRIANMTAHPNASILAQLAEIAKTDPEPWKRLEVQNGYGGWERCHPYHALLNPRGVFRIKPATVNIATVNIGGVELEGPLREAPEFNTRLWLLFDHATTPDAPILFSPQYPEHLKWLSEGRLFASKEARDKYQEALVKLANGETK